MSRSLPPIKDAMIGRDKVVLFADLLYEKYWIFICADSNGKIYEKILTCFLNADNMPVWCDVDRVTCREQRPTEEEWIEWLKDENDEKNRTRNPT